MANTKSVELSGVIDGDKQSLGNGSVLNAGLRVHRASFDFGVAGTKAIADTLTIAKLRGGDRVIGFIVSASADISTATLSFGVAGSATKYGAAQAGPADPDLGQLRTNAVSMQAAPLENGAGEEVIATIGTAALPNDSKLTIETLISHC